VLGVLLFVLFWVLLAVVLVFIAIRGGLGGARAALQTQGRGGRRFFAITFVVLYIAFGIAIPLVFLIGNHKNANAKVGTSELTQAEKHGRELFGQHCSVCHTLAAANATGTVGPNLGKLDSPTAAFIRQSIQDPNAKIEKGFQPNIMPQDFGQKLSKDELDALVDYILKAQE
jgi:mono/diheme cytochrome c family protein